VTHPTPIILFMNTISKAELLYWFTSVIYVFSFGINVFPLKSDDRYISVTFPLHFRYNFERVGPVRVINIFRL
jgi:hypothetical protein